MLFAGSPPHTGQVGPAAVATDAKRRCLVNLSQYYFFSTWALNITFHYQSMDSRIIDWCLKSVFKAYNNCRYAGLARVLRAKYGQLCRQFCSEDGKVGIEMLNTSLLVPMAIYCYIKVIQNSGATHCGFERAWFECVWISFGESSLHIHNTKSRKPPPIDSDHVEMESQPLFGKTPVIWIVICHPDWHPSSGLWSIIRIVIYHQDCQQPSSGLSSMI